MSHSTKAILWRPAHDHVGFCDRLRGMAAGAVFAEELGLKLLIQWEPCEACPVDYRELFEESDYFTTRWKAEEVEVVTEWDFDLNVMPLGLSAMLGDEGLPVAERIVLLDEVVLERWGRILRSLKPRPPILSKIEALREQTNPDRQLGVHLRRTDVLIHSCKRICRENVSEHDAALWSRILMAVEEGGVDEIYLASDDQEYFERWKAKLGELPIRVHFNEATWGADLRQTPLEDLVVDLYLLSSCRQVFGTVWSSVHFVGSGLGGNFEVVEPPDLQTDRDNSDHEKELEEEIAWSSTGDTGLTAVTVCVNYSDYLAGVLENRRYFDEWIIVTTAEDQGTRKLCEKEGLKCLTTDVFYQGGDSFNKARGLNLALEEAKAGNWIVSLDSDMLLPENFRKQLDGERLDPNCLYGLRGRCVCRDPETLEILKRSRPWDALARDQTPWILGYFQMFHPDNRFARRFDEEVSSNAAAYDDQFARDFGPRNWRFLPMTGVHLGEINLHWDGREAVDEETGWKAAEEGDSLGEVLRGLLAEEDRTARILHVRYGASCVDEELRECAGTVSEYEIGGTGQSVEGKVDLIVISAAIKGEDFHPLFRKILPQLKEGGGIVAPFFDASKWPEWTATLALRLKVPERIREDGWCLIRPELGEIRKDFIAPMAKGPETILIPITNRFVANVPMALHSLRKYWQGRISLAVPKELPGPWDRIATTFGAELTSFELPCPASWNDQWGRELERFSLVSTKALLGLLEEKVLVWYPEAICLGSPEGLFKELANGEVFFLYEHPENEVADRDHGVFNCIVGQSEALLRSFEDRLTEGLRRPAFYGGSPGLFDVLSKGIERLTEKRYFRSVWDFGEEETGTDGLVGVVFSDGGESSGKLLCEHFAENEDEVAKRFACEIPVARDTAVAVKVDPDSLEDFYFNFRLWKFPETTTVYVFHSGLSEDDFFFLEERANLHRHDLDAGEIAGDFWNCCVNSARGMKYLAILSPKWKPRPGATLIWPERWGDFKVVGRHGLTELVDECIDESFAAFESEFLRSLVQEAEKLAVSDSAILDGVKRVGEEIQRGSLEELGWMFDSVDSASDEVAFITLSNGGYVDYTLNCFASLQKLGDEGERLSKKLRCYSVGSECHERVLAAGYQSVLIDDEKVSEFQTFRQGGWSELVKYKFDAISRELLRNDFVCYTDGDIVYESPDFLEDCVERMNRDGLELLIQNDTSTNQDEDHSNLCSGFMMIRSTPNTREQFSFEKILSKVDEKFSDQPYVNAVIKYELRTGVLPLNSYPNGNHLQTFGTSAEAKLYHFNYLLAHQKKEMMTSTGKWYL